jgi:hypothetical protein
VTDLVLFVLFGHGTKSLVEFLPVSLVVAVLGRILLTYEQGWRHCVTQFFVTKLVILNVLCLLGALVCAQDIGHALGNIIFSGAGIGDLLTLGVAAVIMLYYYKLMRRSRVAYYATFVIGILYCIVMGVLLPFLGAVAFVESYAILTIILVVLFLVYLHWCKAHFPRSNKSQATGE